MKKFNREQTNALLEMLLAEINMNATFVVDDDYPRVKHIWECKEMAFLRSLGAETREDYKNMLLKMKESYVGF